jgi:hypothetical protein
MPARPGDPALPCLDAQSMVDFLPITTDVVVGANTLDRLIEIIAPAAETGKIRED